MITEQISQLAVKILDKAGYAGAGLLMTLESMIAPVPSEAVMPFVGFQVADGKWNLALPSSSPAQGRSWVRLFPTGWAFMGANRSF